MDRLDIAWRLRIIAQGSADFLNPFRQSGFRHDNVRPYRCQEIVFGDQLPRPARQMEQYLKGFSRQPYDPFPPPQLAILGLESIRTKRKVLFYRHFVTSSRGREMSEFWQDFSPSHTVRCHRHMAVRLKVQQTTRRTIMARSLMDPPSLSIHRAFVVHLRDDADVVRRRISGRVEHVVSGQGAHFASLDELLQFIAQRLPSEQNKEHRS